MTTSPTSRPASARAVRRAAPALPVLALATIVLLTTLGPLAGCRREAPPVFHEGPRRVIVVSLDCLRADHLGCYGYDRPTSPFLDRLAARGVRFSHATAPANWTLPSHVSLFTGLYPLRHGVDDPEEALGESIPTLVDVLRDAGFATASFNGGGFLDQAFGMDRGFDLYVSAERMSQATEGTLRKATAWLRDHADRDVFLFLHTYEIHMPYTPPSHWLISFRRSHRRAYPLTIGRMQKIKEMGRKPGPSVIRDIVDAYDAGIAYTDSLLSRFLRDLAAEGLTDNLLLVIASDHGEAFWEHGAHGHNGDLLGRGVTDVPLIVALPGVVDAAVSHVPNEATLPPTSRVVDREVSFLDVMPTVLEACNLPVPQGLDGTSLLPEITGCRPDRAGKQARRLRTLPGGGDHPLALAEGNHYVMLRAADHVAILPRPGTEQPPVDGWPGQYDLAVDPDMMRPQPLSAPWAERFQRALAAVRERGVVGEQEGATEAPLDEKTKDQLKTLGYI